MDPSEEQIRSWIKEHGSIFRFEHQEKVYFFRRLSRREYRFAHMIDDELDRSEEVCQSCIIWPENWAVDYDDLAGIPDTLCQEILRVSGCIDTKESFQSSLASIQTDIEAQMESVISYAFKTSGSFDQYQNWSYDEFFAAYSRATWILERAQNIKIAPAEEEQQEKPNRPKRFSLGDRADEILARLGTVEGEDPLSGIPKEFDTAQMALKPMSEVYQKMERSRRQAALRNAARQ